MSTTPGLSSPPAAAHPSLRGHFIGFMALACGVSVANIYYAQPLLEQFARQFHTTVAGVAAVPSATQIGYAAGLLLLGPLGDRHARHRVILLMAALLVPALLGAALARSVLLLAAASFAIGMLSSIAQQIIPLVAALAAPQSRGKAIGLVMSGLLVGILGGRVLAGAIASAFDWQAVFVFAATVNAGMWLLLWRVLPRLPVDPAAARQSYAALLRSTLRQFALHRELRLAGLTGGLFFASFSVFWVGLTPLLQSPAYGYGPAVVGAFGVLGIMGAAVAPVSGRYSDRPGAPEIVEHGQRRLGLVQGVEVQPRCAAGDEFLAQGTDHLTAKGTDGLAVVAVALQPQPDPARDFGAADLGKPQQLAGVGDRHDARHHRYVQPESAHVVDKPSVRRGAEKVLRDRRIGSRAHFVGEMPQILLRTARLWVHFRVGGDLDVEMPAGFGADEFDQIAGIVELAADAVAGGQIAAQRHQPVDARGDEAAQVAAHRVAAGTDAR